MNKQQLIQRTAEVAAISKKDTEAAVSAVFDVIADAMAQGERVQLVGFGSFETRQREARTVKVPQGNRVEVAAAIVPVFKPGKGLKDRVNGL